MPSGAAAGVAKAVTMLDAPPLLLAKAANNAALITFAAYIVGVLALAAISNRLRSSKIFLSEYFLGSRSLGVWAFALTFAATSASGGSFIGFPAKVYSHGWIVALWIGSYMIFPVFVMGLLSKRINQVARKTGAITIPDVLRDRFESPALGLTATLFMVVFLSVNLIAQFKGGSVILQTMLEGNTLFEDFKLTVSQATSGVPWLAGVTPGYLISLVVFALVVIAYTTYGGFRAVVWTDVLQGFLMVLGVVVLLPMALYQAGGMANVTQKMNDMTPPQLAELEISRPAEDLARRIVPKRTWLEISARGDQPRRVFRLKQEIVFEENSSTALTTARQGSPKQTKSIPAIELTTVEHVEQIEIDPALGSLQIEVLRSKDYRYGSGKRGVYVTGPGPSETQEEGFLPFSLAISFFIMWAFSGAGQPGNMVRQMAFKDSRTLKRSIFTLSIYYSLIYFPIVIIFCCARVLLPGWEVEPDRIMPEMARAVTEAAGWPWLAGLLVAAPFAAVMSTLGSFLLMISSSAVRDVYQRSVNPRASEKTVRRLTYLVTILVGTGAMLAAVKPPQFLQDLIIFTGTGLSASFLVPVGVSLYWRRSNGYGALAAMIAGGGTQLALYLWNGDVEHPLRLGNFHPVVIAMTVSLAAHVAVSLLTPPPERRLVRRFFYREP